MAILGIGKQANTIFFNWQDVATSLIRLRGIHTGWWRVGLQLDVHGGSFDIPTGKTASVMRVPGGVMTVVNVNITEVPEEKIDPLCVNAAVVNPRPNLIVPAGLSVQ